MTRRAWSLARRCPPAPRRLRGSAILRVAAQGEQFDTLYRYYRDVYAQVVPNVRSPARPRSLTATRQVTVDDIEAHERAYRGSAEEERELKELYTRFAGNMDE